MSTQRVCRCGCGSPIPTGRRSWASQWCVDLWLLRRGGSKEARRWLEERDRGVCALCGLDTKAMLAEMRWRFCYLDSFRAYGVAGGIARDADPRCGRDYQRVMNEACRRAHHWQFWVEREIKAELRRLGFDPHKSLWEADHIVPRVEGGEGCDLSNYRTLCVPCHKRETAELAARRAKRRKAAA